MRRAQNKRSVTGVKSGQISLTSLIQLLTVAEYLNFHHAANVLGTTQSSVSTRIKGLENALGILLFERRHRGVRLTDAGRHFVAEVSAGIAQLDHAVRTAGAMIDGTDGHLAIGLHSPIAAGFLADLRHRYRVSYPMIEQSVLEGRSSDTIALVREGRLDVAFVVGAVNAPDCHSRPLWCEPVVVALPFDHPLAALEIITWLDLGQSISATRSAPTAPAG